ncbi:MAG: hypothetical protein LBB50_06250 [Oscillospiraceae bacterium]|nr:hypothetical protein [Oscillospiraceae bacterium]
MKSIKSIKSMKSLHKSILAILLALVFAVGLTACGAKVEPSTEPTTSSKATTTQETPTSAEIPVNGALEPSTTADPSATTSETASTESTTEGTTVVVTDANGKEVTTVAVPGTTFAPTRPTTTSLAATKPTKPSAKTPDAMNKTELVEYFNKVANAVRTGKPAMTCVSVNEIVETEAKGLPTSLVTSIVNQFMDGKPVTTTVGKGADNWELFLAKEVSFASKLRVDDVTGTNVSKSGSNWVITLSVKNQTNPTTGDNNAYGRVFDFLTPQGLLDELGSTVKNSPENITLNYNSGKVTLTVTPDGKVLKSVSDFKCDAFAPQSKVAVFTLDITAHQHSHVECNLTW